MTTATQTFSSPSSSSRPAGADAPTRRRRNHRAAWAAVGFVAPLAIYLAVFYLIPLIQNFSMSVHRFDRGTFVHGGAPFVGFDIYREVAADPKFWTIIGQTAVFTFGSIAMQFVVGLALAVFFKSSFRLSYTLRAFFLVPWLLPMIVSGTTWQWMMDPDNGILNSFVGLFGVEPIWWLNADNALWAVLIANIWLGIPFNLVILYSGLQNIPQSLYEAASIDGAGAWRQFWSITLPSLRPVSLITLLLGIVYTLKVVDIIWIMTSGTGSSQTLGTWAYGMAFGKGSSAVVRFSEASAVGSMLLIVALIFGVFYLLSQRKESE
jgi:multiple sugar transport system permease protein